ncbi:MAG: type I methionyl aminopeptidase [Clostridiales bacterium]|jgi:methionyl aminopeptidase|nr:type I methionyl aminopeptidase [Clostridiales bacterium]
MIVIKNAQQVEKMRVSSRIVKEAFELLEEIIAPGITTRELETAVVQLLKRNRAIPSFKNYRGFPRSICISVNEVVVHGLAGPEKLKSGDIVSIDIGAFKDGFHGDAARTFAVGEISKEAQFLIDVTRQSFFEGIKYAKKGNFLNNISAAIEEYVQSQGLVVVREFVGHGVGAELHEAPEITNFNQKKRGPRLRPGMTLAIEPMVTLGTHEVIILDDGWTAITQDKSLAAHYENTVLITEGEPEILTI